MQGVEAATAGEAEKSRAGNQRAIYNSLVEGEPVSKVSNSPRMLQDSREPHASAWADLILGEGAVGLRKPYELAAVLSCL